MNIVIDEESLSQKVAAFATSSPMIAFDKEASDKLMSLGEQVDEKALELSKCTVYKLEDTQTAVKALRELGLGEDSISDTVIMCSEKEAAHALSGVGYSTKVLDTIIEVLCADKRRGKPMTDDEMNILTQKTFSAKRKAEYKPLNNEVKHKRYVKLKVPISTGGKEFRRGSELQVVSYLDSGKVSVVKDGIAFTLERSEYMKTVRS